VLVVPQSQSSPAGFSRISTWVFLLRKGRLLWSRAPQPPFGSGIATNFSLYCEKDNIGTIELNGLGKLIQNVSWTLAIFARPALNPI
jgi:hypothetical protein